MIRRINADGTIQTIAGIGIPGYGGDGRSAASALLNNPVFPNYDSAGNLYFLDFLNYRIRRINTSGIITTVAGTGIPGMLGGATGPAAQAQIGFVTGFAIDNAGYIYFAEAFQSNISRFTPPGQIEVYAVCPTCAQATQVTLATDSSGNLYVSDQSRIFRISPDGVIHNFAGFGTPSASNTGNGGPALNAPPSDFITLAADAAGNLYTEEENPFVTDSNFVIRKIGTDGVINIVAGTFTGGSDADGPALQTFLVPGYGGGLVADASGTVTFAEGYRIRQLTTQSTIQTLAPTDPQPAPNGTAALDAWFLGPNSIAFDGVGNFYIGQSCIIQEIDSNGTLSTVAGTGQCSTTPPNGPALTTELNGIFSMAVDRNGQIYFADASGSIYMVSTEGAISTMATIPEGYFPLIAVDSQSRVYFFALGGLLGRIAPGSPPQYVNQIPGRLSGAGIAIDASDNVYICCDQTGVIDRYSPDLVLTRLTIPGIGIEETGIAVDSSCNIWQGSIFKGLLKGTLPFGGGCCSYGDGGAAESAYIVPAALAFGPGGDLYVLEDGTNSVRRIHGSPPTVPPAISGGGIVNAASLAGGTIAPGELITIFGSNFGPSGLDVAAPQNNSIPDALNNVHVYFGDTQFLSRITARSATQINVFVPYGISSLTSVQVIVDVDGVTSVPVTVPVAPSAFGLSTADASGSGQGAIFNQDGSYNSHSNPAARGTIVTMFGTGEGVTTPALPDGALEISTSYSTTQAPVTVMFGDQTAVIQYAGAAPFLPTGVFQIDATIPNSVTPGDLPITVSIGGIGTTRTVTVAVE